MPQNGEDQDRYALLRRVLKWVELSNQDFVNRLASAPKGSAENGGEESFANGFRALDVGHSVGASFTNSSFPIWYRSWRGEQGNSGRLGVADAPK